MLPRKWGVWVGADELKKLNAFLIPHPVQSFLSYDLT